MANDRADIDVGLNTKPMAKDASSASNIFKSFFKGIGGGIVVANQGFELLSKGLKAGSKLMEESFKELGKVNSQYKANTASVAAQVDELSRLKKAALATFADIVNKSPTIQVVFKLMTDKLREFVKQLDQPETRKAIEGFFRGFLTGAQIAIATFQVLVQGVIAAGEAMNRAKKLFQDSTFSDTEGGSRAIAFLRQSIKEGRLTLDEADKLFQELAKKKGFTAESLKKLIEGEFTDAKNFVNSLKATLVEIELLKADLRNAKLDTSSSGALGNTKTDEEEEKSKKRREAFEKAKEQIENNFRTLAELEGQHAEARRRYLLEAEKNVNEDRFQQNLEAYERGQAKLKEQNAKAFEDAKRGIEEKQQLVLEFSNVGINAVAGFIEGMVSGLIQGNLDIGAALAGLAGTILSGLGDQLIAMGGAAVAAGILGSVAPIFAPATGGPAGVAAGVGLIAAGAALKGIGAGISSKASTPSTSTGGRGDRGSAGAKPQVEISKGPRTQENGFFSDFGGRGQGGPVNYTQVVNLQGITTGSPATIGEYLNRNISHHDRLRNSVLEIGQRF